VSLSRTVEGSQQKETNGHEINRHTPAIRKNRLEAENN
jgi:hypothetical protein